MRFLKPSNSIHAKGPLKVLAYYVLFSAAWIVVTDLFLEQLIDSSMAWHTIKGLVYVAASGCILYVLCRKLLFEAHRLESTLSEIFQQSEFGIFLGDRHGKVLDCNDAFGRLLGYKEDELIGSNIRRFIHPDQSNEVIADVESLICGTQSRGYVRQRRYVHRDGTVIWARVAVSRIDDPHNQSSFLVGLVQNISSEVATLNSLRVREAELNEMLMAVESAYESILITDLEGKIVYVNPAFEALTGYSKAEVVGKSPSLLKSGRTAPEEYEILWRTLRAAQVWTGRFWNRRKDGSEYLEDVTISPVRDKSGLVVNYLAVKKDITRENALENRLLQTEKLEAVGQLTGGVAHDLNNVLQVVQSSAELALRRSDRLYTENKLLDILTAGKRGAAIIAQLLAFTRKQALSPQLIDLNQVITETGTMLRRLLPEDVELVLDLGSGLRRIQADPVRLSQVLLNLAVNARDAMPQGGVLSIFSANVYGSNNCALVRLRVEDTGMGISPEIKSRIFEPFFTTKEAGRGTGLGLATVNEIVEQSAATMIVESAPGKGTRFQIDFAAVPETEVRLAEVEVSSIVLEEFSIQGKILVCEDEASVRSAICDYLEAIGVDVMRCENATEAMAEAEKCAPEILITDVVMPGRSGVQLAQELRARHAGLKVLLMTGHTEHEILRELENQNQIVVLQKPFTAVSLVKNLKLLVAHS